MEGLQMSISSSELPFSSNTSVHVIQDSDSDSDGGDGSMNLVRSDEEPLVGLQMLEAAMCAQQNDKGMKF
jgi:hypothetical protein